MKTDKKRESELILVRDPDGTWHIETAISHCIIGSSLGATEGLTRIEAERMLRVWNAKLSQESN